MSYNPVIQPDHIFDAQHFTPVFRDVCCGWIPDLGGVSAEYDTEGLSQVSSTWIVPRHEKLPLALRQMLSWNREYYSQYFELRDWLPMAPPNVYFDRPIVPVSARLTPLPTNNSPTFLANHFQTEFSNKIANGSEECGTCDYNVFPSIYTDKYRLDVQWARDEFTNRFGIKYAKVEVEPSIRLESISGSAMGLFKIKADGTIDAEDGDKADEKLTTGFPSREPQTLIKVTFPWVSLRKAVNILAFASITNAGPIGFLDIQKPVVPGQLPNGMLLGAINHAPFLGYPRGHVLYQSAALVEKVSPVTGRLGYQITHDFLCLGTAEWNMARRQGAVAGEDVVMDDEIPQESAVWPYGFIVAVDSQSRIILKTKPTLPPVTSPIFPYPYADLTGLFYYGGDEDSHPNDEA